MSNDQIEILVETERGLVRPGATLRGGFRVLTPESLPVDRVELSVLWYTDGKGDMDEDVIHNQILAPGETLAADRAFAFQVPLPDRPWSYSGRVIKIHWVVRVRVYPASGKPWGGEEEFRLHPAGWKDEGGRVKEEGRKGQD